MESEKLSMAELRVWFSNAQRSDLSARRHVLGDWELVRSEITVDRHPYGITREGKVSWGRLADAGSLSQNSRRAEQREAGLQD